MSKVFFIGDTHFGHRNILKFSGDLRPGNPDIDHHDKILRELWNETVSKNDTVFMMGDLCMNKRKDYKVLEQIDQLNGTKYLVRGNHDYFSSSDYLSVFKEIYGMEKYKKHWLTHCPMHPDELWKKDNIHGHVHSNSIMLNGKWDPRYINVSVEACGGVPVEYQDIVSGRYNSRLRKC